MPRITSATNDRGATVVEYALLLALVAVVSIGALSAVGDNSSDQFDEAASMTGGVATTDDGASAPPAAPPVVPPVVPPADGGGGGAGGGDGVTTTTAPPATMTTTTTAPPASTTTTTTPPTTVPAPAALSEWNESGATLQNKNFWNSSATVAVYGNDGKPLTTVNASVNIRVVTIIETWDGKPGQRTHETQANLVNGKATFSDANLPTAAKGGEHVVAIRYEVVGVTYWWPTNPTIKWDGATPRVTVLAP